jgi:hypothetical protein
MNLLDDGIPKSGRHAEWVYYMLRGRLCLRRYVVPHDPRTPGQLRSRAAFAAASKAWSHSNQLTQEQRGAWYAAGAKIQSHPRLGQSGPLTGQQHFVGRNCAGAATREETLWEPAKRAEEKAAVRTKNAGCGGQNTEFNPQVARAHKVARPTWSIRRGCAGVAPGQHRGGQASAASERACLASRQTLQSQAVPRPTWERYRGSSRPLPGQRLWSREHRAGVGGVRAFRRPRVPAGVFRNEHWRGLWHGS